MHLKVGKSERSQTRALVSRALINHKGETPKLTHSEILVWVKRLWAVQRYRDTGSSALIEEEAARLSLTAEQVIDLYHNRIEQVQSPLLAAFTDDLIG
ncbi:MAG: hypothetical protein JKY34_10860 [Kordiimonadaceae bacterium]|nr:hypothetical protein [Kordiimonadaceae bacterium]